MSQQTLQVGGTTLVGMFDARSGRRVASGDMLHEVQPWRMMQMGRCLCVSGSDAGPAVASGLGPWPLARGFPGSTHAPLLPCRRGDDSHDVIPAPSVANAGPSYLYGLDLRVARVPRYEPVVSSEAGVESDRQLLERFC